MSGLLAIWTFLTTTFLGSEVRKAFAISYYGHHGMFLIIVCTHD
jgi:hypothetical protein